MSRIGTTQRRAETAAVVAAARAGDESASGLPPTL